MNQALPECFTYISLFKIHNNYSFHFTKKDIESQLETCEDHKAESGELGFGLEVLGSSPKLEGESWCPVQTLLLPSLIAKGSLQSWRKWSQ